MPAVPRNVEHVVVLGEVAGVYLRWICVDRPLYQPRKAVLKFKKPISSVRVMPRSDLELSIGVIRSKRLKSVREESWDVA
jgi:hypothetical protein